MQVGTGACGPAGGKARAVNCQHRVDRGLPGVPVDLGGELATRDGRAGGTFGTELVRTEVRLSRCERRLKLVETYDGDYLAPAVIITRVGTAQVGRARRGGVRGRGVSYCAVCDGAFFSGPCTSAVAGGGDAAEEEALFLTATPARSRYHRRKEFRAQPILLDEARKASKDRVPGRHHHRKHRG